MQTWQLQSEQEFTLTFDRFNIFHCIRDGENQSLSNYCDCDYVEISDGSSTQRYCGTSTPAPLTTTNTITVKLQLVDDDGSGAAFLATITGSVDVTTNVNTFIWSPNLESVLLETDYFFLPNNIQKYPANYIQV